MTGRRFPALAAALAASLLLSGCGERDGGAAVPEDSVYVQAMARLVFIDDRWGGGTGDGARADSLRREVLEAFELDEEALERWALRRGTHPARMEAVWERIADLVDRFAVRAARGEDDPLELAPGAEAGGPEGEVDDGEGGGG